MIFANDINGERIEAEPKAIAFCPSCEEKLQAKCGPLKVWHWSHIRKVDCDPWYEPETEWHLSWKRLFGTENCEVVMPPHRADILGNFDVVIELQHSSISIDEIKERERFYKKMIWLVDAHDFVDNLVFFRNTEKRVRKTWSSDGVLWKFPDCELVLSWKYVRKCWLPMFGAQMPVMLDFSKKNVPVWGERSVSESLFWLQEFYLPSDVHRRDYSIGGRFVPKQRLLERYTPNLNKTVIEPG